MPRGSAPGGVLNRVRRRRRQESAAIGAASPASDGWPLRLASIASAIGCPAADDGVRITRSIGQPVSVRFRAIAPLLARECLHIVEAPTPSGSATENQTVEPREYRRAPEARRPSEAPGDRPVTAAPYGAVRAVPRVRQPSDAAPIDPQAAPSERARMRQERAPAYSAPSVEQPSRPTAADPGAYRSSPGYRRAPDGDAGSRMRAVPRSDAAPSAPPAPSYRSAPEQRQGPSGPPPSAAPPPQSGPSGDRGDRGSAAGSRQRSGESQSSGQGAQRRR